MAVLVRTRGPHAIRAAVNLLKVVAAAESAARADDAPNAHRVMLVYFSEGSGIIAYRVGVGFAQLGGDDETRAGEQIEAAMATLWPNAPLDARRIVQILGHAAGRISLSKILGG